MNNRSRTALLKVNKAIEELDKAILTGNEDIMSVTSSAQLNSFKDKLLKVACEIESDNLRKKSERNLGISRVIVDQWPFDLQLGLLLIEAEQAYKDC